MAREASFFDDPDADVDPTPDGKATGEGAPPPRGGDILFQPDVVIADGDVIEGDGWSLEAIHTPGHASNHLCYFLREEGTLCTGDHVVGWSTSVARAARSTSR